MTIELLDPKRPTAKEIFNGLIGAVKSKVLDYLYTNNSSARIFKKDFTEEFLDDLRDRRDSQIPKHVVLTCFGETGNFKTGIIIEIGRFMSDIFSEEYIMFTDKEFLDRIETIPDTCFVMRDEVTKETGIGSGRQQDYVQMQQETLRRYKTSMAFCSPEEKIIGTAHYIIHCIGVSNFKIVNGKPDRQVYVLAGVKNPSTGNYLGGIVIPIEWNNPIFLAYESKKMDFMERMRNRDFQRANFEELALKVFDSEEGQAARTKDEFMLAIHKICPDLTAGESHLLVAQIKMMKRNGNL
jgi:hypothetical protein